MFQKILFINLLFSIILSSQDKVKTKWMIAEATNGDKKVIYRFLSEKPKTSKTIPLKEVISITWKYGNDMPDKATQESMEKLENALHKLTVDGSSELSLVITGLGSKEWCYYAKDYPKFMKDLNKALTGHKRYPIKISHSKDPEWKYWHSFTDKILKKSNDKSQK